MKVASYKAGSQKATGVAHKASLKARFTDLGGIYADLEYIPVAGTRYDDGCDRSAPMEGGCKGVSMWVPKGARYPGYEPDDPIPASILKALSDTQDPEAPNENGDASHTSEVDAITAEDPTDSGSIHAGAFMAAAGFSSEPTTDATGCDGIADLAAWLDCEDQKRKGEGKTGLMIDNSNPAPADAPRHDEDAGEPTGSAQDRATEPETITVSGQNCDDIMDLNAWLACEEAKRA